MQPKLIREQTVVEILDSYIQAIPLNKRTGVKIEFGISGGILQANLRTLYNYTVQRLLHLTYYLECSRKIGNNEGFRPEHILENEVLEYVPFTLHHFEKMEDEHYAFYNNSLASWINYQVLRDLSEFLGVYLGQIYETCIGLEYALNGLRPQDVVEMKMASRKFEQGGLKERLETLRKEYGFALRHNKEILSLYVLRNILSHHDGVVKKAHCNKQGYLEVIWPRNQCKLKKQETNEWIPYHKRLRGNAGQYYDHIKIDWLGKPEVRRYTLSEIINLSSRDMNDISFMYLYAFNELHGQLVHKVSEAGLHVTPFSKYMIKLESLNMFEPDEKPEKQSR